MNKKLAGAATVPTVHYFRHCRYNKTGLVYSVKIYIYSDSEEFDSSIFDFDSQEERDFVFDYLDKFLVQVAAAACGIVDL